MSHPYPSLYEDDTAATVALPGQGTRLAALNRLRESGYPSLRRVQCELNRGVLKLQGRVPNFHQKQLAQVVVNGLEGVDRVINELTVEH